jgi:hypothetical protein
MTSYTIPTMPRGFEIAVHQPYPPRNANWEIIVRTTTGPEYAEAFVPSDNPFTVTDQIQVAIWRIQRIQRMQGT